MWLRSKRTDNSSRQQKSSWDRCVKCMQQKLVSNCLFFSLDPLRKLHNADHVLVVEIINDGVVVRW